MGINKKLSGEYRRAYYPSGPWIDPPGRPPGTQETCSAPDPKLPNPDPSNYIIKEKYEHGKYLVVKINYPDCINFEGNKILVFEGISLLDLVNQKIIDPHFFKDKKKKYASPIARFVPSEEGWQMARRFVHMMEMSNGPWDLIDVAGIFPPGTK